ncbi:MAG: hypothetical protein CMN44_00660 [SAR116 cluster bacterium]|nr:hypothetical protein [SAR116 cluster bacterium]RPH12100.1 MAG: hypothetical protein CBC14_000655 [Alphaproteobacteria bacterium TMED54]|tara:strand:+ start:411 stop:740 length:330 start_codon:yes stop_codon:yes gene_type:complete
MPNSKLMSYITSDFQTKSDLKVGEIEWEKIMQQRFDKFKNAGALRQTVSQIWNKEGALRLGHLWEYRDEKSFIECQKIFREAEIEFKEKTGIEWRVFSNRGVILYDVEY